MNLLMTSMEGSKNHVSPVEAVQGIYMNVTVTLEVTHHNSRNSSFHLQPPTTTSPVNHQGSTTILKDYPSLSQILGDRPVLTYRQPPNLKQTHNKNTNPGTDPCNKARCQLCPHIYSRDTIIGPNHISHTIRGLFTCTSTNVIYAIMSQQCPSAMYNVQTGQSLCKRINGHKSDVKNYNIQKPVGEHFKLPGHSTIDLKVEILQQKNLQKQTPMRNCRTGINFQTGHH
ncbi:uncharacterized protein [Lepidochelys kempii]